MDVFFENERGSSFCIEVGYWDTVLEIKEKIEKYQRIPVSKQTLFFQGKALQDDLNIEQCDILHNSRLQLFTSPPFNNNSKSEQSPPKKLSVTVVLTGGTRKIPVEVNAEDSVGELRKELARIQQRFQFSLPQESYFFIHKQNAMDDHRSFQCHRVDDGDTIEMFNGSISGGYR